MNCPICGSRTNVIDSRPDEDSTRRRRECQKCKHRFSTVEIDTDYYRTLKPLNKYALQNALLDGYTKFTEEVYSALGIKERKTI